MVRPTSGADSSKFEGLGVFYLGRVAVADQGKGSRNLLLYDSQDLVTHAVCVGMTGSGKTGLGVALLEEAALDGIPALVIDPKGDLTNLLLTFPGLSPAEFAPWVDPQEARRAGQEENAFAAAQAELWRRGLAEWGQDGKRIERLRAAAEFAIYTPGSDAGLPIAILRSLRAPGREVLRQADLLGERIATTVSSLLELIGIDADPVKSREHILLSALIEKAWNDGEDLDLQRLVRSVQRPPIEEIGVLDLETFFPESERTKLALRLNGLLASPGFRKWLEGPPLDIDRLLFAEDGRPRVAIMTIAHLSDAERMFFVSLLLSEFVAWMRGLSGTATLRALVYMDEVFGFMPPVSEPPSKKSLLTLLKQARAYGVGLVLATQNPVDLDYKGLSNAGTWFLGRLQTEQDKRRVLDGLQSAAGSSLARESTDRLLSGLGKRQFILHNVHAAEPALFETRWVMSYLRGPLTRPQIRQLMAERLPPQEEAKPESIAAAETGTRSSQRPVVESAVEERFARVADPSEPTRYAPYLVGEARVEFVDRSSRRTLAVDNVNLALALRGEQSQIDWADAVDSAIDVEGLADQPEIDALWAPLPTAATRERQYPAWTRQLAEWLYRNKKLELLESSTYGLISEPGESERDFRIRLREAARERRTEEMDRLRKLFAHKVETLEDRIARARDRAEREKDQARQSKLSSALSVGSALASILTGRKGISQSDFNRAASAVRRVGRASQQAADVERADEAAEELTAKLEAVNIELATALEAVQQQFTVESESLATRTIRPRRQDVEVRRLFLCWQPDQPERSIQ